MKWHLLAGVLYWICQAAVAGADDNSKHIVEGVIDAPVVEVWKVMTTREGLEKCVVAKADIDLRIGGYMKTHYDPKGTLGDAGSIEHSILSFEPMRMFSFRCVKTPEKFPFKASIKKTWTVIYFEPIDEGHTKMRIVGCGYDTDEESQKMKKFFDQGNAWTIKNINEKLTKKS